MAHTIIPTENRGNLESMTGKTVVITGGNVGIGLETARGLAGLGARVILACRDAARAAHAVADIARTSQIRVERVELDLGSLPSVQRACEELASRVPRLDVLINNAGVWPRQRRTTADGREQTMGINHIGHFALTQQLLPLLRKARGRVVVVSSGLHARGKMEWDDLMSERGGFSGQRAYAQSKLANLLFANELARREKPNGVTVNSLHPGVVKTQLAREFPELLRKVAGVVMISPEKGAQTSIFLASSLTVAAVTGKYFEKCKEKQPSKQATNEADAARLWQWSEAEISKT
jgi:NAD(P)-dependent dehydrogenase (short-subunit alcohol dehydrogenase family)